MGKSGRKVVAAGGGNNTTKYSPARSLFSPARAGKASLGWQRVQVKGRLFFIVGALLGSLLLGSFDLLGWCMRRSTASSTRANPGNLLDRLHRNQ
jgi:hypothetical protein